MLSENRVLTSWLEEILAPHTVVQQSSGQSPVSAAGELRLNVPLLSVARSAMACEFEVLLNRGQHVASADRAIEALDLVGSLESLLSVYRSESDFTTVNRFAAQRPIPVSSETYRMLEVGKAVSDLTRGAFDLTAGSLSDVWGFSRRQGVMPTAEQIETALQSVGYDRLHLIPGEKQVSFTAEKLKLNPGGIGKGFALDRSAMHLLNSGVSDFMMHGGASSVVAFGDRLHADTGGGWLVALKHPFQPQVVLGTVRLQDAALGTSGSGKQFFHFGGRRYSHIIDPRSGWPADDLASTTVITPSAALSDALATGLFVLGREAASEFLSAHTDVRAIITYTCEAGAKIVVETFNTDETLWQAEA